MKQLKRTTYKESQKDYLTKNLLRNSNNLKKKLMIKFHLILLMLTLLNLFKKPIMRWSMRY